MRVKNLLVSSDPSYLSRLILFPTISVCSKFNKEIVFSPLKNITLYYSFQGMDSNFLIRKKNNLEILLGKRAASELHVETEPRLGVLTPVAIGLAQPFWLPALLSPCDRF